MKRIVIARVVIIKEEARKEKVLILKRKRNADLNQKEWTSLSFIVKNKTKDYDDNFDIVEQVINESNKLGLKIKKPRLLSFESHVNRADSRIISEMTLVAKCDKLDCLELKLDKFTGFKWIKFNERREYNTSSWLRNTLNNLEGIEGQLEIKKFENSLK